jgi:hypothetical protein
LARRPDVAATVDDMRARQGRAAATVAVVVAVAACGAAVAPSRWSPGASGRQAAPATAVVWAVGDADAGAAGRAVVQRIAAGRPDRVLYLGDVYEHGTSADYRNNFAPAYRPLARRIDPTPGNHDWPGRRGGYEPFWRGVYGRPMPAYYTLAAGGWQLLSLNSEAPHGAGSAQLRWLRGQLAAGAGTCRLAFWHRPRWSASSHHGDQRDVQPLWSTLRGRATIVLGGHDHDMQRFRPRDGITEFVSGAGGHDRYPVRRRADLAFGDGRTYGALRLVLTPGLARYAFIAASGATLDSGAVRCRAR